MKTSSLRLSLSLMVITFLSTAFVPVVTKEGGKEKDFRQFLSYFDAVNLPYHTTLSEIEDYIKTGQTLRNANLTEKEREKNRMLYQAKRERSKAISNPDFLPEAFLGRISRMGPPLFEPLAQLELGKNRIGVVYASSTRYENFYKQYKMLVFNKKGELLNAPLPSKSASNFKLKRAPRTEGFLIAQTGIRKSSTFNIDAKGHIWINTYEHEWANDIKTCAIEENTLVNSKLVETEVFEVNSKGQIEEMKEYPTVAKACLD